MDITVDSQYITIIVACPLLNGAVLNDSAGKGDCICIVTSCIWSLLLLWLLGFLPFLKFIQEFRSFSFQV